MSIFGLRGRGSRFTAFTVLARLGVATPCLSRWCAKQEKTISLPLSALCNNEKTVLIDRAIYPMQKLSPRLFLLDIRRQQRFVPQLEFLLSVSYFFDVITWLKWFGNALCCSKFELKGCQALVDVAVR